jgi:CubicO group peptidase (beta-lactamase class C family)
MQRAVSDSVFPGGVLLAAKDDAVLFHRAYGYANLFTKQETTEHTVFDLASLTKPLATTLAVIRLIQDSKLTLSTPIGGVLPQFAGSGKEDITLMQLLAHTSGYPAYRPYYMELRRLPAEQRLSALRKRLIEEVPAYPAGRKALYSDLGFMVLRWVIETVSGERLDRFVNRTIYAPLELEDIFFIDLDNPAPRKPFAATEECPWRKRMLQGEVHDDNAHAVGGIEGHAGLFGTASDVYRLLSELLAAFHESRPSSRFESSLLKEFLRRQPISDRALGFDMPSASGSSSGGCFSPETVGHLGFTGTSFWMDLKRSITVILLTNRVHPGRENEKIKIFRPRIHDAVMQEITGFV